MKNATQCERSLKALLKKLGRAEPADFPSADDGPLGVLLYTFLLWESTAEKAQLAYAKVMDNVVDLNDLRVTMPHELESWIGVRYPRALDRAQRIRACLRDVYLREHAMTLERVEQLGKREIRKFVESLNGIVPFVSSRLMLVAFDIHGVPVDEQLRTLLIDEGAADVSVEVPELAAWLTRHVKAADAVSVHAALQRWVDGKSGKRRPSKKKTTVRKKTKTRAKATSGRKKTTTKKRSTRGKKTSRR